MVVAASKDADVAEQANVTQRRAPSGPGIARVPLMPASRVLSAL